MRKQKDELSSQEVAEMLGTDLNYLYYLRRSNQLLPVPQQGIRVKPRLRYRRSDVETFISKREADKEAHTARVVA